MTSRSSETRGQPEIRRRDVLGAVAASALVSALPLASAAESPIDVTELDGDVALLQGAGANVVVVALGEELVAIDGGAPDRSDELLEAIATNMKGVRPGVTRPGVLFNTNWRPEHTGLNDPLGAAGARIVAHKNTKLWMGNDFRVAWEDAEFRRRAPSALPNETYYTSGPVEIGGEAFELIHLPRAHTDGDICIRIPGRNVLVVSDLLAVDSYPILDYVTGGWIGGMIAANERLLEMTDDGTTIVPAVGPPQRRGAIAAQLALLKTIYEDLRLAYTGAQSVEEFLAAGPAEAYRAERGDPELFLRLAYKGIWGHIRDIGWSIV